jgi:aminoglycoside phosphotransferase (APT) family kinase protein
LSAGEAAQAERLGRWLEANVPGFSGLRGLHKYPSGQSNPTYRLDAASGSYVMRRKPSGTLLKSAHLVEREYRVMKALGAAGFPVPRMLALCEDADVIGSAFYVMALVEGRIFWNPSLPGIPTDERRAVYDAMNEALARLHGFDPAALGLADYGRSGDYFARQIRRWSEQYRLSETIAIPDMEALIAWLGGRTPPNDGRSALVHGDWRIDNLIFAPDSARLRAAIDWELSTLGHPFADLAYQCMQWRLPNESELRGLGGVDRETLGIPSERAYVEAYARRLGVDDVGDWTFLIAFSFFRVAAIVQGVYRRALDGNASNPERARRMGDAVPLMARLAIEEIESADRGA